MYVCTTLPLVIGKEKVREVYFYKDYFLSFYKQLPRKIQLKVLWTLRLVETFQIVSTEYLKHIEGANGLYEIRIQLGNDIYRVFCFFDKGKIIVLGNGFQKKTQKTPRNEIEKALKIKLEYETSQ